MASRDTRAKSALDASARKTLNRGIDPVTLLRENILTYPVRVDQCARAGKCDPRHACDAESCVHSTKRVRSMAAFNSGNPAISPVPSRPYAVTALEIGGFASPPRDGFALEYAATVGGRTGSRKRLWLETSIRKRSVRKVRRAVLHRGTRDHAEQCWVVGATAYRLAAYGADERRGLARQGADGASGGGGAVFDA